MRRSKTVIDSTVQVVLNGRRQIASHMISYAPHAQERMKNHFTMIARVSILTSPEFILNLTATKLWDLVLFICFGIQSAHSLALTA